MTDKLTTLQALRNIAPPKPEPVKSCETCKWSHLYKADAHCASCERNTRLTRKISKWEAKSHD